MGIQSKIITRGISISHAAFASVVNNSHKYLLLDTKQSVCGQRVEKVKSELVTDLLLYDDFINLQEQDSLMREIDRSFRRTKYQYDHWDGVSDLCLWPGGLPRHPKLTYVGKTLQILQKKDLGINGIFSAYSDPR